MLTARKAMGDYRRICLATKKCRILRVCDAALFHADQLLWLTRKLPAPLDGRTLVVTYIAPGLNSVSEQQTSEPVSAAFAS